MNIKKIVSYLLICAMLLSFCACSSKDTSSEVLSSIESETNDNSSAEENYVKPEDTGCNNQSGHDYNIEVTKPNCTATGYTTKTCKHCKYSFKEDFKPANGHSWGEWEVVVEATKTKTGNKVRKCSACKTAESQTIPKLGSKVDFSALDALIDSLPVEYERYITTASASDMEEMLDEIEDKRNKMDQSSIDSYYTKLKKLINTVNYRYNDIDAIYLDYDKAPVKGGGFVPAYVAVVDVSEGLDKAVTADYRSQARVRGNTTGDFAKTPYNIKFSKKTDLFGMGAAKTWYLIANAFDKSLMRNAIALSFADAIGVKYCAQYHYVDLFVNGEYRGNYMLVEKIETGSTRIDINPDNGDYLLEIAQAIYKVEPGVSYVETSGLKARFEINEPENLSTSQMNKLQSILDKADAAIASGKISEMKKYIDVDSFVNFYIANEYLKMLDFHFSSPRFHIKNGIVYAGPVWDFDLSMGNANINYEPYYDYMVGGGLGNSYQGIWCTRAFSWYIELMKNPDFKKLVKARYLAVQPQIVNLYEDNSLGKCFIDRIFAENYDSFNRNFSVAPWKFEMSSGFENVPQPTLNGNINELRNWLKKRNEWMLSEVSTY